MVKNRNPNSSENDESPNVRLAAPPQVGIGARASHIINSDNATISLCGIMPLTHPEEDNSDRRDGLETRESLYRAKWLIAHNRLHDLAHGKVDPNCWADYLEELEFADMPSELLA